MKDRDRPESFKVALVAGRPPNSTNEQMDWPPHLKHAVRTGWTGGGQSQSGWTDPVDRYMVTQLMCLSLLFVFPLPPSLLHLGNRELLGRLLPPVAGRCTRPLHTIHVLRPRPPLPLLVAALDEQLVLYMYQRYVLMNLLVVVVVASYCSSWSYRAPPSPLHCSASARACVRTAFKRCLHGPR
ncbi:hypothetical protein EV126DRAFT_194073 [Verticillium dahliae]|nr:hypothetical protein EV126DRAFT_194073 [Verticillium dahliae]